MRSDGPFLRGRWLKFSFYALRGGLCVVTPMSTMEYYAEFRFYALRGGLCVVTVAEVRGV